jgi:hypothetical protein
MTDPKLTPPPELVQQWGHNANLSGVPHNDEHWAYEQHIATRAAQWGADQELEACLSWLQARIREGWNPWHLEDLRNARRPKPPSLKEQALDDLVAAERLYPADWSTIRRALEALPND